MIKIVIVAIMTVTNPLDNDSYQFTDPHFKSLQECVMYVNFNIEGIRQHLSKNFPDREIANLYCVPEKNLKKHIENTTI